MNGLVIVAKLRAEARLQLKLEFVFCLLCFVMFRAIRVCGIRKTDEIQT